MNKRLSNSRDDDRKYSGPHSKSTYPHNCNPKEFFSHEPRTEDILEGEYDKPLQGRCCSRKLSRRATIVSPSTINEATTVSRHNPTNNESSRRRENARSLLSDYRDKSESMKVMLKSLHENSVNRDSSSRRSSSSLRRSSEQSDSSRNKSIITASRKSSEQDESFNKKRYSKPRRSTKQNHSSKKSSCATPRRSTKHDELSSPHIGKKSFARGSKKEHSPPPGKKSTISKRDTKDGIRNKKDSEKWITLKKKRAKY